jgi:DNA-directed RNA polymerase subunit RPC12/RpoP
MPLVPITVMGYRCGRCGHEWIPRDAEQEPSVCPKCKTPYWNKPRRQAASMLTYESFRDKIQQTLKQASGPLTWTEIRTTAKLPEKFPNNKWVRRLEADIALQRKKDTHGIIMWSLGG